MFHEGQKIGHYTLLRKLGKGGFGEVWLAERRSELVTKKVAVKLPHADQVKLDAIRQEAALWEQASGHANVLPIIDAHIYDGQVLIVSEYADGGSLDDKLKQAGKLPVRQAIEMTVGILDGLEFLHSRKIIHRDIKPQNILLQGKTPRLADFGISRAMQTTSVSSTIIGTDAYMSPEAFEGKRNVQSDIWSVGVVLYQLLTGKLPFPQEHPTEKMFAILMKDFEPLPADVPPELQRIIGKALAKNPAERFQTASAMQEDLKEFLYSFSPPAKTSLPPTIESTTASIGQNSILPENNRENVVAETVQVIPPAISQPQTPETLAFRPVYAEPGRDKKPKSYIKPAVIISLAVLLLACVPPAGYFIYQKVVSVYQANKIKNDLFSGLSKQEMELLLEDLDPITLKKIKEDPAMRKQQIENLKQLFAIARQSVKDDFGDETTLKALETIDSVVWARTYDQEINKDKGQLPPFGFITEDQVKAFYGEGADLTAEQKQNAKESDEFLKVQMDFARKNKTVPENQEPSAEEIKKLREEFAKIKIYEKEARAKVKAGALPEKFARKVELQSKIQKVQFLSRIYSSEVLAKKTEVTDAEIDKYLAEHAELNTSQTKKAKADEVLRRLKNGADFAALAKEFSDDPGSKEKGGLYENVVEGSGFDKTFESAALALQPGQISPNPIETTFGFHIIKLERKSETKDANGQIKRNYDVRHILFSTMFKDPENPSGRELPVKEYVKSKLEAEKEKKITDKILADNPVSIAEDFRIREVSDEEIKKSTNSESNGNQKMPAK